MNNIETTILLNDLKKYLNYTDKELEKIRDLSDMKLNHLKREIEKIKDNNSNTTRDKHFVNISKNKIKQIANANNIVNNKKIKEEFKQNKSNKKEVINQKIPKKIHFNTNKKPRILFISDVKGWAWWIKSTYIKKYLGNKFDIDIIHVIGDGCTNYNKVNQNAYDLYFTWGYSYIDFLSRVPKHKKATGITAHRRKNVILPKMQIAGWHHANSIMLLKEMHQMGFKNTTWYVPNGIDTELFKPITPLRESGDLVAGHVGKECAVKGQREYILPAIKKSKVKSVTNLKTWKDKIPHSEMPKVYNQSDVFLIASVEDGTPNPGLESAACGRPIISNHIGNMPELIVDGYNGFLVPRKIEAYVDKINYFKNNRNKLVEMGSNMRKSIEEWNWKYMSRNYLKFFDTIFGIKRDKSEYENIALKHLNKI